MFSFLDPATNLPAATPDRTAAVAFIAPGETEPGRGRPGRVRVGHRGRARRVHRHTEFPRAGAWKAVFTTQSPAAPEESIGVEFDVRDGPTVDVGEPAPPTTNPTAADVDGDLAMISTDTDPDPAFYELSVADALAERTPFVLVFATPAFCQSAQCGPTLDRVKAAAAAAPTTSRSSTSSRTSSTYTEGRLQPVLDANGQLQPVAAVERVGHPLGAVDLRGRRRRDRARLVRGPRDDAELQEAFETISG